MISGGQGLERCNLLMMIGRFGSFDGRLGKRTVSADGCYVTAPESNMGMKRDERYIEAWELSTCDDVTKAHYSIGVGI